MTSPVTIVDKREPPDSVDRLMGLGLNAVWGNLATGDYVWFPHKMKAAIERKTIPDFLGSIVPNKASTRLAEQVKRMVEEYDISFLLLEGRTRRSNSGAFEYYNPRDPRADKDGWAETGWGWDSITGILLDIQLLGIVIVDCPVIGGYTTEVARVIINTSREEHSWLRERGRPPMISLEKTYNNAVWSLCAFDKIGPVTAKALLTEYGSVSRVVEAIAVAPKNLTKIQGIGDVIAESLHKEVTAKWTN